MATQAQLNANRQNAMKSTGPVTDAGKAISRFNALKSGLEAKSLVIPGEDPAQLEALTRAYHQDFSPATVAETYLVELLIRADWTLRRYVRAEAEFLRFELTERRRHAATEFPVFGSPMAIHLDRRIAAADRTYHKSLKQLQTLQLRRIDAEIHAAEIAAFAATAQPGSGTKPEPAAQTNPAAPAKTESEAKTENPAWVSTLLESAKNGFVPQDRNLSFNLTTKSGFDRPAAPENLALRL